MLSNNRSETPRSLNAVNFFCYFLSICENLKKIYKSLDEGFSFQSALGLELYSFGLEQHFLPRLKELLLIYFFQGYFFPLLKAFCEDSTILLILQRSNIEISELALQEDSVSLTFSVSDIDEWSQVTARRVPITPRT